MQNAINTHVVSCTTCSSSTHSSSEDTSTVYDSELSDDDDDGDDDDDDGCKVGISLRSLHKHWHARMLQVHYPEYID